MELGLLGAHCVFFFTFKFNHLKKSIEIPRRGYCCTLWVCKIIPKEIWCSLGLVKMTKSILKEKLSFKCTVHGRQSFDSSFFVSPTKYSIFFYENLQIIEYNIVNPLAFFLFFWNVWIQFFLIFKIWHQWSPSSKWPLYKKGTTLYLGLTS
jgi:hypothetical protein